jgi:hypothetical protein
VDQVTSVSVASVSRQQRLINYLAHHDSQQARETTIVNALAPRWMSYRGGAAPRLRAANDTLTATLQSTSIATAVSP